MQSFIDGIAYGLGVIVDSALSLFYKFVTAFFTLPLWVWNGAAFIFAVFSTVVGITISVVGIIVDAVTSIVDKIGATSSNVGASGNFSDLTGDPLAVANTFYPLDESFNFAIALMALWLICTTVRIIKSWLPQIAGTGFTG